MIARARLTSVASGIAFLAIALAGAIRADQVILVPGTISGVARVGTLPISSIFISAAPQAGGSSTSFSSNPNVANAPYSMPVSVPQTGTAVFNVTGFNIRTDANRDSIRFNTVPVTVSAATPGQKDFVVDNPGFISPTFTVTGSSPLSSVSLTATYSVSGIFEQASTNTSVANNLVFAAIPRAGMTLAGTVTFVNGLQLTLPSRTIDVVADQTTPVAYTVDGATATGSIAGTIALTGAAPVNRWEMSVNGPSFKSVLIAPPTATYSVDPLPAGTYSLNAVARLNNFDDTLTFPTSAYAPGRTGLAVGSGETTVNIAAAQAFINGVIQLTGGLTLQPFVNSGSVSHTGTSTATSGGSSSDQMTVATRAYDAIVTPGTWRRNSTFISFSRPAPSLSGNFSINDSRPTASTTIAAGDTASIDIPIALGEVTITVSTSDGSTFSNPSVSASCTQRDDLNVVLWTSSVNFSTSGQNNVTSGSVTFVGPSGQCTVTPRVVINGQTVSLSNITMQVIAGTSQTVDAGGPSLIVTSPVASAIVATSTISGSGKASDDVAVASVTVNGIATNLSSAGNAADPAQVNYSTVAPITLQRGPNVITTIAKDTANPQNTTTDTRTVYWDTALPSLSFTPLTGVSTSATSIAVAGTASDDAGVQTITVNGASVPFTSTGNPTVPTEVSFSTTVPLVIGSNPITVVVTDISTRTTTQVHTVTRQPATTSLSVAAATGTYGGTTALSATLSATAPLAGKAVSFSVNGTNAGSATTNASGVASLAGVSIAGINAGTYPNAVQATFAGDAEYLSSTSASTLTVSKAGQSIAFGALANKTYGDAPFSVAASASSGLPVSFAIQSGPATILGSTVTLTGSGTVVIRASQPGDANFNAATSVDQSFQVAVPDLNVTSITMETRRWTGPIPVSSANAVSIYNSLPLGLLGYATGPKTLTLFDNVSNQLTFSGFGGNIGYRHRFAFNAPVAGTLAVRIGADFGGGGTLIIDGVAVQFRNTQMWWAGSYSDPTQYLSGTVSIAAGPHTIESYGFEDCCDGPQQAQYSYLGAAYKTFAAPANTVPVVTLSGQTSVTTGVSYPYTFTVTDPDSGASFTVRTFSCGANGVVDGSLTTSPGGGTFNCVFPNAATTSVVSVDVSDNFGAVSNTALRSVTSNKLTQTISFPDPPDTVYGADDFAVSASASSGLPVTIVASGPCALTSGSVHINGAGTCVLTASQAGNATYSAATNVVQSVSIAPASLTVKADDKSRPYGSANPPLTATISGFVNGEVLATSGVTGGPALTTVATTTSPVGGYPITAAAGTLAAANYAFVYATGTLTVNAVQLTVTARSANRPYGAANPDLSTPLSITGFAAGENATALSAQPVCSTAATASSPVGPYSVTCSGGSATNYTFAYAPGTLTVDTVQLTVTAASANRSYGAANPDLSAPANIAGFVLGETASVLTTQPTCSTTATAASVVGGYPVVCGGATATNYTFAYVNGTLTVDAVQLTVVGRSATRLYGADNPDVSTPLSMTGFVSGENATMLSAQPTCATAATASSPVGSYPVTCSGGGATNYTFAYVPGTLTVDTVQLTVTAASANRPYGAANPDLSAPANIAGFALGETASVLATQPTCSTAATLSSVVGGYPVVCGGAAATNYTFAYVNGTLTVDAVQLTVTARSAHRDYGAANPDLSAPLSVTGFAAGESVAALSAQPTCSTTATSASPIGSYAVTCSGGAATNYTFAYVPGTLTVDAVQLTVTAASANRPYGAANPDLSAPATIAGFVLGEAASVLATQPTCSTTATPGSVVGGYPVVCAGAAATNYTFAYVNGTLTVDAVQLTVTARSAHRAYGAANPDLSTPLSITGFVEGEAAGILSVQPTCSTTATPASNVGSYPVTCTGGAATNYTFTYLDGALVVDAVQLTVTARSDTRPYGSANPDVSTPLGITGFVAGESATNLTTQPTCSTDATSASLVGAYQVTCTNGAATNYTFTYQAGTLTVSPVQLTVTAKSATRPYASANPDLSAPFSVTGFVSGETIAVLTSQPTCGTTATQASGIGSYPVSCAGAGAGNYTFVYVDGSLKVEKVQLTVTGQSPSRLYGAANPSLSAPQSITGFVGGETAAVLTTQPTCTTFATPASPVGSYPVTCGGAAAANYTFLYVDGGLSVGPVQLTITAKSNSRRYGSANPDLSAPLSITGFVLGETSAVLSAPPVCATTAVPASPIGSYPVTCGGAAAGNYSFTYVPGTLSVTRAPLTVSAGNAARQYSDPSPTLTYTITGFVNGETIAIVAGTAGITTTATQLSPVGTYPIVPSIGSLTAANYSFSYFVNGTLAVVKEDAMATYTGLSYVSTASATSSTATVALRATIQDITAVSPGLDGFPGDIRTATVQFVNRDAASAPLCSATLTLVNAADTKTATATCNYTFNIGSVDSDSINIGVVVNGNYMRNSSYDDAVITISKPLTAFITGGGYLVLDSSSGTYGGTPASKMNFGFNAKSKGKNTLQGKVNVIIRKDGRVYQIKSTAIESLTSRASTTTAPGMGSFQSKGTLQDITDPLAPISLGGNLTIQMTFTDIGEPGSADRLALTVWDGGTLLLSSRWNGVATVEQLLGGGNVVAR